MKRLLPALAVAVVARMVFHALFLPAFEGPDEPHHLARIVAFAEEAPAAAFAGRELSRGVVGAVKAFACAPALAQAYGCPPFAGQRAAFDLLRTGPAEPAATAVPNPEANQPPLFYLAAGLPLRALPGPIGAARALLYARLLCVAMVAAAVFGPLRVLARGRPVGAAVAGLLALLLPGAAESLARCSNDAAVFLWAAFVLAALEKRPPAVVLALLLAAGPLLKLTAIPVVVFAVVALFAQGRKAPALVGALSALAVFPVQLLRGWLWGGTVELNRATPGIGEDLFAAGAGFARSAYAFVKTTFWVGGWTFLRPPPVLAAVYLLLLIAALVAWRPRADPRRLAAHAAALAVAGSGFCVFALANRRFYGVWGGVAGWYLWGWSPWIGVAATDLGTVGPRAGRALLWAEAAFVVAANAAWIAAHAPVYGL